MESVRKFYAERCRRFASCGWMASHWFSQEDQDYRFSIVKNYVGETSSLLDVGCGQGDVLQHLSPQDYLGIDCTPEMIAFAKEKFPSYSFEVKNILEYSGRNFEAAIAVGSFGLRIAEIDNYSFLLKALRSMARCSDRSIVVAPKTGSSLNIPYVFFYEVERISEIASRICSDFSIDESSLEHEFILCAKHPGGAQCSC